MQTVLLMIHLVIAVFLIGLIMLQKSEGGALGIGGSVEAAASTAKPATKIWRA